MSYDRRRQGVESSEVVEVGSALPERWSERRHKIDSAF